MPKPAKTKSSPAPSPSTPTRSALNKLVARHGPLSAEWRAAFGELLTDEGRAELGGKTRSENVLREGVAWAVSIDADSTRYPAKLKEHYSEPRLRYFLESLVRLDDARQGQQASQGSKAATVSTTESREAAARAARNTLINKLKGYAGGRAPEKAALAAASATTENLTTLGKSIDDLVALGKSWLALKTRTAQLLCESAGLTAPVLAEATKAAEALANSATDTTLAGRSRAGDAPEVNIAEGTVLHEMAEAMRCLAEAHAESPLISKLTPGPGTRAVLAPSSKHAVPTPTPAPGATPAAAKDGS